MSCPSIYFLFYGKGFHNFGGRITCIKSIQTYLLRHYFASNRPTGTACSQNLLLLYKLPCVRWLVDSPGHWVVGCLVLWVYYLLSLTRVGDSGEGDTPVWILRGGCCDEIRIPRVSCRLHPHLLLLLLLGSHCDLLLGALRSHHLYWLTVEIR